ACGRRRELPSRALASSRAAHGRGDRGLRGPWSRRATGDPPRDPARRDDADDHLRRPAAHDRARPGQRPGRPRRTGVAPSRPDRRPAGHAHPVRRREHRRLVLQRRAGRFGRPGNGRPDPDRDDVPAHRGARRGRATGRRHGRGGRTRLMDPFLLTVWIVRLLFLGLLYLFLFRIAPALVGDLRAAAREPGAELGRLVVVAPPSGEPAEGTSLALDAIATIGRDVNNAVVVEAQFVSAEHAILTFRGRAWYVEDLGSTNGTFVNGSPVEGVAPIGFGDVVQIGQV